MFVFHNCWSLFEFITLRVELWLFIIAVFAVVLFTREPNSDTISISLSISELASVHAHVVDISTVTVVLSVFVGSFIDLSGNPAFAADTVLQSLEVDLSKVFFQTILFVLLSKHSEM
jgi:hypothetical protein